MSRLDLEALMTIKTLKNRTAKTEIARLLQVRFRCVAACVYRGLPCAWVKTIRFWLRRRRQRLLRRLSDLELAASGTGQCIGVRRCG